LRDPSATHLIHGGDPIHRVVRERPADIERLGVGRHPQGRLGE
jgi:hypothetical protein